MIGMLNSIKISTERQVSPYNEAYLAGVVLFESDSQCNTYVLYLLTPLMTNGDGYLLGGG